MYTPGPIWTPLIPATLTEKHVEKFGKSTPLGRAGMICNKSFSCSSSKLLVIAAKHEALASSTAGDKATAFVLQLCFDQQLCSQQVSTALLCLSIPTMGVCITHCPSLCCYRAAHSYSLLAYAYAHNRPACRASTKLCVLC
jgi:hypothetical protein